LSTTTYTEHQLVDLLQRRDDRVLGYLYDNYSGALYTIILQIVADPGLADEVLQEVFVHIWRKMESYDPSKGRLFTWMLNIARNASVDVLRADSYQNSRKNEPVPDNGNRSGPGLDVGQVGLKQILERLKKEHRVLIELAYFKGYTPEEIADIENIPLETVKAGIRNALVQLREYIR